MPHVILRSAGADVPQSSRAFWVIIQDDDQDDLVFEQCLERARSSLLLPRRVRLAGQAHDGRAAPHPGDTHLRQVNETDPIQPTMGSDSRAA